MHLHIVLYILEIIIRFEGFIIIYPRQCYEILRINRFDCLSIGDMVSGRMTGMSTQERGKNPLAVKRKDLKGGGGSLGVDP